MRYTICHPALPALETKVGALIQQAAALDRTFSLLVVKRTTAESANGVITDQLTVELKGDRPAINGWDVIASLQFNERSQALVNAVPDCGVPERFLHAPPVCEQCGVHANELLVLRNLLTGACLLIDQGCVPVVLGATGPAVVQYAALLIAADAAARQTEGNDLDTLNADRYAYRLDKYLAQVARVITLNGWCSRRQSEKSGKPATSDLALDALFAIHDMTPEAAAVSTAETAIAWARQLAQEQRDLSDYERRLHEIAQQDVIRYSETGLAASLLQAHQSAAQRAIERQLTDRPSRHFGQISERLTVTLLVLNRTEIPKPDGVTVLYKFVDPNGNRAAWFASTDPKLEIGLTYHLKATVIRHSEFRGIAETILNRCKVLASNVTQLPLVI
jgi:hypothetical protein